MKQCATCKHWIPMDHPNKRDVCGHPSRLTALQMAYYDACERWESLYPPQVWEQEED